MILSLCMQLLLLWNYRWSDNHFLVRNWDPEVTNICLRFQRPLWHTCRGRDSFLPGRKWHCVSGFPFQIPKRNWMCFRMSIWIKSCCLLGWTHHWLYQQDRRFLRQPEAECHPCSPASEPLKVLPSPPSFHPCWRLFSLIPNKTYWNLQNCQIKIVTSHLPLQGLDY